MLKLIVLLPFSLACSTLSHLGVRPAGLISKSEVPFWQGILPVQDGVSQLPPATVRVGGQSVQGPATSLGLQGMDRGHSPAGPQAPCLGNSAEPASGFEAHAAHNSVPDILPMLEEEGGKVGAGEGHHLPTSQPYPMAPAFGGSHSPWQVGTT